MTEHRDLLSKIYWNTREFCAIIARISIDYLLLNLKSITKYCNAYFNHLKTLLAYEVDKRCLTSEKLLLIRIYFYLNQTSFFSIYSNIKILQIKFSILKFLLFEPRTPLYIYMSCIT